MRDACESLMRDAAVARSEASSEDGCRAVDCKQCQRRCLALAKRMYSSTYHERIRKYSCHRTFALRIGALSTGLHHHGHVQVCHVCDLMTVTGSKILRLSEHCDLPSDVPMSADANLSRGDMSVECVLERFEQERVANKSSDPVLSKMFKLEQSFN